MIPDMVYCDTAADRVGVERHQTTGQPRGQMGPGEHGFPVIKHPCPALRRAMQSYLTTGMG